MTLVISAVVCGVPILVGSGYFPDESPAEGQGGEPGESGTHCGLSDTATESRGGVELIIIYDSMRKVFTGTVRNTTSETVRQVRVEVHLPNGVELGPTPNVNLVAVQTRSVELDASSRTLDKFSVHVEIRSGEGGRESGGG